MITYNKDSYGGTLRARFNSDVSTANSYQIHLEPQNGDEVEKTATLGTSDVYEGDQLFEANKYVEYVIEEDILSEYVGRWRAKGIAFFTSSESSGEYQTFRVTE